MILAASFWSAHECSDSGSWLSSETNRRVVYIGGLVPGKYRGKSGSGAYGM